MKHLIQKTKRRITDWKKSFPKHISNKGSVLKLDQTAPFTFGKDWKTHLTKKIRRYVHRYFLKWKKEESLSHVWLFATTWTVTYQALPSMGFSRQEYWSGLPFPFPGDLPNPGIEPGSPALQADALPSEPPGKPYVFFHQDMIFYISV